MTILDGMKLTIVFGAAAQIYMIIIYFMAKQKKPHASFALLISAAFFTLLHSTLVSISYFIEISQDIATTLYRYGLYMFFPAIVLGVLGLRSLIEAYVKTPSESQHG